jgi:hypothetical protein
MPYIEIAVPLDISTSEPLVAAHTLPAEERPVSYLLQTRSGEHWINLTETTEELTLHKAQQHIPAHTGMSVIKIHGSSPLRPKGKLLYGSYFSYMSNTKPEFFISLRLMACVFLNTTAIQSIRSHSLLCSVYANRFVSPSNSHSSVNRSFCQSPVYCQKISTFIRYLNPFIN